MGNGAIYRAFMPEMAALTVVDAEMSLGQMDLPASFYPGVLDNIRSALARRAHHGFATRPTSRIEVNGLVSAAMGDYDHLHDVWPVLCKYVVGVLQTDDASIQRVRDTLLVP